MIARKSGDNLGKKPAIGIILGGANAYTDLIWSGIATRADSEGYNTIAVVGGNLSSDPVEKSTNNIIYQLVNENVVDGLIVLTAGIGAIIPNQELRDFCHQFSHIPLVSIGIEIEGASNILLDNQTGLRDLICHLINEHDCRRIASLLGPPHNTEAQIRFQTLKEVLSDHDLPFDDDLMVSGGYNYQAGRNAIDELLQRGVDFDAVACFNDSLALGAMRRLQEHGKHVPNDVAVIGFDDIADYQYSDPPLSTVRQPRYELGEQAFEAIYNLLNGAETRQNTIVMTEMVVRQSCGCSAPAVRQLKAMQIPNLEKVIPSDLVASRAKIQQGFVNTIKDLPEASSSTKEDAIRLFDALYNDLETSDTGKFLDLFDTILHKAIEQGQGPAIWQEVLSLLRLQIWTHLSGISTITYRVENLIQQARIILSDISQQAQFLHKFQSELQTQLLFEINEEVITTFDLPRLMDALVGALEQLGIFYCFLCLNDEPGSTTGLKIIPPWSRLIMAYRDGELLPIEPGGIRFPTAEFLPEEFTPDNQRIDLVVLSLRFQNRYLGYAVFEMGYREGFIYNALQIQISNALHGARLIDQLSQARKGLEARVEERTAELRKEISERSRIENILRENEQRYRALFEENNDAVFIIDLNGQHLMANQRAADLLGYSIEELTDLYISQVVAPDEKPDSQSRFETILTGEVLPIYERNFQRKDGSIVPVEINIALVSDSAGNPLHVQSIVRDISKRKRTERILQALNMASLAMRHALAPEEIFQAVGNELKRMGIESTIFQTNHDLSQIFPRYYSYDSKVVATVEKLMKVDLKKFSIPVQNVEIFRKTIWEQEPVLIQEPKEAIDQLIPQPIKGLTEQIIRLLHIPRAIDVPLIVAEQTVGMLSVQSKDLIEEDIPMLMAFANQMAASWQKARLMQDLELSLAEQLQTEESLRASEGKFRTLFELSPEAIVLVGLNGIILDANQAAANISGRNKNEIIGQSFLELGFWSEEKQQDYLELFSQVISGEFTGSVELQFDIREGESMWLEVHPALLKEGSDILALQIIIRDITYRRKAELAIQERVNELEAIYQTSIRLANASLQTDEIAEIAVKQLGTVMKVDGCSFSSFNVKARQLTVIVGIWFEGDRQTFRKEGDIALLDNYPALEHVLNTLSPAIIQAHDPEADPAELAQMQENDTATLVIIPLFVKSQVIGIMKLETYNERHYSANQLNLVMTLANQIAVALDNARLFESAQQELNERLQAERALQESEEQFRSIFENAIMGLYRITPDDHLLMANPALIRMLGYDSFDQLANKYLAEEVYIEQFPRQKFKSLMESNGHVLGIESAWKRRDGSILYIQESARAIYGEDGRILFYEGTVEDISHRKQAEALQRLTEERFNKAFNTSPLAMGIQSIASDSSGVWLLINDAFTEMTGYTRDEVIGYSTDELILYAREDQANQARQLVSAQEYIREFEFEFRKKDGKLRYGLLWTEVIDLDNEKNALVLVQDITEKKKIEKERQSLIEFQRIVATLSARFINISTDEIENDIQLALGSIAEYAQADASSVWLFSDDRSIASKAFGWPSNKKDQSNQAISTTKYPWVFDKLFNFESVIVPQRSKISPELGDLRQLLETYKMTAFLTIPLISEGKAIGALSIQMRDKAKNWSDDLEPLMKIIGDIIINAVERKRAEESIRKLNEELELRVIQRTQQLEAANTELEAFAYSVSHDLRAPLRAIDGFSLALMEDYADHLDENANNYLERVRAASQRMGQLIDDLLKLSQVTRSEMVHDEVDLSQLVGDILAEFHEAQPERMATFKTQPNLVALGDKHLLQIMLTNLCSNAWKFTSKKAQTLIEFGRLDDGDHPIFYIRDNGSGFDMTYADKLFNTFQRLHPTEEFEGTGIGLATVKRIVQRHGGRVWAESQVDRGAIFYFTIGETMM